MLKRAFAPLVVCAFLGSASAWAAPIILDDFESGEGHFASTVTFSGTNRNLTGGTADQSTATAAQAGTGSELLGLNPLNPGTSVDFPVDTFRLRFLSGGGTPANNVNFGANGYIGYFLKTTVPNLTTAIALDDGAALELGTFRNVNSDGAWHLYQWNLNAASGEFSGFAGTGPNGKIDGPTVTIDSIFIQGPVASAPTPLAISLDTVASNATGDLVSLVPEPGSLGLAGAAIAIATLRRATRKPE